MKIPEKLRQLVKKHKASCEWKEGKPIKVFHRDGYDCVQYESGNWWHYNTKHGTWF